MKSVGQHGPGSFCSRFDIIPRIAYAPALFLACFVLSASSVFFLPLNHDVSWLLFLAGEVRGGMRLYADILEINPPLIVWLTIPVSATAELAHISAGNLFRASVLALALASIAFAAAILRRRLNHTVELSLLFAACYGAVALVGYDFGQREHLSLLLSMPYLAMAVLRLELENTRPSWRMIAAVMASVGFALKPHFLLVPLFVEGLVMLKSRSRPDCSSCAIAGAMGLYLAAILAFTPEYLPLVKMLSKVYGTGYLGASPFAFVWNQNFQLALISAVAFLWLVRPMPRGISPVVLAAVLGFAGAALVQNKGWSYHWYPVAALCWLLFSLAAAAVISRRQKSVSSAAPIVVGLVMVTLSAASLLSAPRKGEAANPFPALLAPAIQEFGGGPVAIFSNTVRVTYPLVTQPGIGNSLRRVTAAGMLSAAIRSENAELETYLRDIIIADIVRYPPQLLIAEIEPAGLPSSFDFVEYLSRDPVFAHEMTAFRPVTSVANFRFYQRIKPHVVEAGS